MCGNPDLRSNVRRLRGVSQTRPRFRMRVRRTPSARRYYSLKGIRMNLRTLGLRKSSPLRADHPGIGQRRVLCKHAIRAAIGPGSFHHSIPRNQRWPTASSVTGPASRVGYLGYDKARPQRRAPPANSSNPGRTLSTAKPLPASAAMRTPAKPTSSSRMAVHSNTLHCHAESGLGDRANASATPQHWRFGSLASTCTWRVTPSTDGLPCTRWRTPGA